MTQPQPILHSVFQDDLSMTYSSLNNTSGSFNPASYTRAFFGSPFSWRPGSFGNRSLPGTSPTQLLGPLEYVPTLLPPSLPILIHSSLSPTDLRGAGKISSSIESDRGSILNALSAMEREDELVSLASTLLLMPVAK
jgi:transcription factor SFP1